MRHLPTCDACCQMVNFIMTLFERNTFFKAGIFFSAVIVLLILAASFFIAPVYTDQEENTRRPVSFFQNITGFFLKSDYLAVHVTLAAMALFSFIVIILIFSFFQRTSASEILYIVIFVISFSFESIRLVLPLSWIYSFPSVYLTAASRILLFTRVFGSFSLFAAGILAAGFEADKTRYVIFVAGIAAIVITANIPIDVLDWDTGLNAANGHNSMFRGIEFAIFITTTSSFFIAAKVRESKEYIFVAIGTAVALAGRNILLGTDNWLGLVPGLLLLSFGIWFICSKLHKIYLWL